MKKNILTLVITSILAGPVFAATLNLGDQNTVNSSNESTTTGFANTVTNSQNTNTTGQSNTINGSSSSNISGSKNNIINSGGSTITGNSNSVSSGTNASVIGSNNSVSGDSGVAIGNNNTVSGNNSIAIGGGTASEGGIAIGSGSSASRADEMNVGNRQITGVKAGVNGTDAVNVTQLKETAVQTEQNANHYTDSKVPTIINEANQYTDYRYNQAMDDLFNKNKGYVDSKAYQLNKKIDNYKADAFAGVAGAMAMASIPKKEGFTTSYGIAVSNYRNQQAIAAGIEHNTTDRTVVKFNFSSDTQGGVGVGAGMAFGN